MELTRTVLLAIIAVYTVAIEINLNTFGHVVHFCENGYMMAESYHGLSYDIKDGHFVECKNEYKYQSMD